MPQGDKYISFTNFLRNCHKQGQDKITLSFSEIEKIWGFPLSKSMRTYYWGNDRTQSYALGWLYADYTVIACNLTAGIITFAYTPDKVKSLFSGDSGRQRNTEKHISRRTRLEIPLPSDSEVDRYLCAWNNLSGYRQQESALNKLFFDLAPMNNTIEDILVKAATLNDFYSTNIFSIFPVAQHILSLNIDSRLHTNDLSLVSDISHVRFPNGKEKTFYSFATKYCSHHKPEVFPIYDDYINKILRYYRDTDGFSTFTNDQLLDYTAFAAILRDFQNYYGLGNYSLKQIDRYLWQLGKEKFPKKY